MFSLELEKAMRWKDITPGTWQEDIIVTRLKGDSSNIICATKLLYKRKGMFVIFFIFDFGKKAKKQSIFCDKANVQI